MARKMIFKNYWTGEVIVKKAMPKTEGRSITYGFEHIGRKQFFVVRDYYTNQILHKFSRIPKLQCSLEFYPKEEYNEYDY